MQGGHALQTPAEAPADAVLESTGDTIWSSDSAVQPQPNPSTIFASAESAPLQSQPVEGPPQPVAGQPRQPRDQQAALDCICAISRQGGGRAAVHRTSAAVPLRAPSGASAGDPTAPQADQFCFFILMRSYPFQCIACEFRREARKYSRGRHPAPRVDRVAWELVQHGRGGRIGLSHLRGARRGGSRAHKRPSVRHKRLRHKRRKRPFVDQRPAGRLTERSRRSCACLCPLARQAERVRGG